MERRTPVVVAVVRTVQQSGQNEGVHNVHTLGFGSGRVMSQDIGDSSVSGHR
jgi:hypothetical protein